MVVMKYWSIQELFNSDRRKFEFFGAEVVEQPSFLVSFPVRFYPAIWTPVLGTQHLLPDAGLIIFAEGHWPASTAADTGRRCCEAPTTGKREWHVHLQPVSEAPAHRQPDKGWDDAEFPPLELDELDRVLQWNWNVTKADREMCRKQLARLLEYWRKNPSPKSQ